MVDKEAITALEKAKNNEKNLTDFRNETRQNFQDVKGDIREVKEEAKSIHSCVDKRCGSIEQKLDRHDERQRKSDRIIWSIVGGLMVISVIIQIVFGVSS